MNSRFLALKNSRLTHTFFLLSLFLLTPLLAEAQCPPTITVTNAPGCNVTFVPPIASLCSGDSCTLTSSVSAGTYQWYNSGTPIPDATSRVYYPTTAGNYTVLVDGCATPSSHVQVKIDPKPFGFINFSPPSPVCEGTIVEVELEADPGSPYDEMSWWKPDEISGNPNPFSQGFFTTTTIRAIVSNNLSGCTNVVSKTLVVHQPIDPGIINEDQTICSGFSPMELTGPEATGGDGVYTYQWQSSINSGITWSDISGATSLDYQPGILTQTTLFRRIVFNSSPCPAVTQYTPVIITVNEIPTVTSPAAVSICSIEALNYTPTSSVPGTTFAWTGVNTSGTVTGVSPSGTGSINDILSIPAGGTVSGTATYTIIPTGPAPTFCEGDPFYLVVTVLPLPIPTISGPTPVCFGSSGNLYATEPGMSGYVWTISPGGTINSGQGTYEISVTWTSTTGPKWVRVTYTGTNGCESLIPTHYDVTVNSQPDPVITGPNEPCLGASGNVYSTAAGMTNYIWNVSPGNTITGNGSTTDNTAIVTWNMIGTQWISLTYTDANGCTNTTAKQYFVNVSSPTLSGPQSPCLGSTGNVYTAGSGNTDYVWIVSPSGVITSGGGVNDNTATVTWNATGAQTISVNYTTAAGCTASAPATLAVDVQPLPIITLSGDNNVCAQTTGLVYTTESGKSLYDWAIIGGIITSGGTPGSNTATVTWNTTGLQQISVNYTDINGCSAEEPKVLEVTVKPLPTITITGSDSECIGTTAVVYSTELGMSGYDWTISGGVITAGAGTHSIEVTWTTVGSRWVAVNYTAANGCDAATPTQYPVTVLPLPVPTVTGSNTVCVGATNVEYATETGMSGYQWTVPTGGTIVGSSTNNNVFVTWNTVGPHTVSVTYSGTNGCAASSPTVYNVNVNPLPIPSITGSNDVCRNSTDNVYTTQPGMSNYVWNISGGTITAGGNGNNTATVTWNTTGNQSISVNYEQSGCPAASPTIYPVFVNPLPTVDAGPAQSIQNGTSTVLNGTASGGTGALSYQWTPVDLIASGATSLTPTTENIYVTQTFNLEVTDSKSCAVSDQVVITALGDPLSVVATATPDVICNDGAAVQLGATANGGNSSSQADYTWTSTPAGFTSNSQNPTANPTVTTTYNVSVWDGYNTATNTILVTVNPLPTLFTVTGGGEYCAGGTGVSVGLNGSQTGVNYQLLLNGTDIGSPIPGSGGAISFINNTASGTYTIRAINGTTTCERDMTGSVTITVNPLPTAFAGNSELIPYGTNTTLTGIAGAGTPPYTYLWTPAASIAGSNTSLSATTTNLYTNTDFTFRVTDSKTCVANDIVSITLDGSALAVTATAVEDIICNNGETVQLNASVTGGNSSTQVDYSWTSTPAGFTSSEQSPQANPTQTTIYYISVNDGYNTATSSVTVTVNPLPIPYTVTGGGEYCSGESGRAISLNGSQSGINYQLLLNGANIGSPIAGTGAALSFGNQTSSGLYTVRATNLSTTCERIMTGSVSISVNPLPVASAGIDKSINHGTSTSLNGSASSGTSPWSYLWTPADMINSGANTSNPVTENLYTTTDFELTVTDSKGCTDTDQMQVIVVGSPLFVDASVDNSTICSGTTAQLSATGSGGNLIYTYSWSSNPAGWTSMEQNPLINPTVTTDYTVTIDDGYNTATSSIRVTVNPLATVYNVTGGGSYCSGDAGVEVGISNSETGVNYQLHLNGTPVGSAVAGTGALISFGEQTGAGSYTVKATTAITGCENDMAGAVDVNILPLPTIYTMTGGGSYPQGGIGVIVGITNSQIGVNYQLLLNGADIGTPVAGTGSPLDFGYQTGAGDYTAIGIDMVTGCTVEMLSTVTVVINPYPTIFHVYGGGSICSGSSIEIGLDGSEIGVAYTLLRGGTSVSVGISGTGDSIHFGSFSTQGIYTVRAENISTGLTLDMDGNAEIIVNPLPIPYSLSYFQPGDNCVPIIPRVGGSEIGAVYELNYEVFNGYYTAAIETINGTGSPITFSSQTNSGIYTVSAYIDYTDVICRIDMHGSLVADSIPKEFQITPQGQLCENDQDLCLVGSEAGINYRLWLNSQPIGAIVPGDINGGPICFGTLSAPGTYRINAINTITGCEIFFTNQVVVNPQPIQYVMFPVADCAGSDIILENCQVGIDYYLYHEPASKEFIEVQGPLTCSSSGPINFGPQVDEGVYRIKAVNPLTNCWAWMDGTTTIYPNPEIFEISPQSGGCAPLAIYLENFETDATYYLYRGATLVSSIAGSSGSVNFGLQSTAGTYTVKAKLTHPGGIECWSDMSGEVNIYNSATVYTLSPQGPSCPDPDVTFRLLGSDPGINYTLWHDVSGAKETIVGTGAIIYFSPQSEPGQYWVIASTGNSCQTQMNGIGIIHEIPALYTITPSGYFCSDDNLEIGLSNSDLGVTYHLHRANTAITPPVIVPGTGSAISFGINNWIAGTYTVLAIDDVTSCERLMDGALVINNPPNEYQVLANGAISTSGLYCAPATIGLELSQLGVDYTLHSPDGNNVTLAGTGFPLDFGSFTYPGEYSVTAFNSATACSSDMLGTVNIYDEPEVFILVSLTDPLYCFGDNSAIELVLNYSQIGASYQLYKDDDINPVFASQAGTGGPLSWTAVSQHGPGDYYVKSTFIADPTCSAVMNGIIPVEEIELPTAALSGTEAICYSYCTNIEFDLTGTLPFEIYYSANGITQAPVYFTPGNEPFLFEVCPLESTTYEIVSIQYTEFPYCEGTDINGTFDVVVEPLPVIVDMGSPATTCITEPYTTNVIAENTSVYSWVILGTPNGTISSDNTLNTTYTPAAGDEGTTVQLELTAWGAGSCAGETTTSILDILIEPIPVITQLDGGTICETGDFTTSVSVDFASAYLWEVVTGNGTVSPNDGKNTTYTAAPGDGGTTVILQLTATGSGTCSGEEVTGQVEIIVEPLPTVDAGLGGTICESESFQLNGSATNQTAVLWEIIDGIGSFDDETILNAVFTPGDVSNNTAMTLRLSASGSGTCNGELVTSEVIINVEPLPEADAGLGGIICETQGYHFANASVQNNSSFVWEIHEGAGHFDDPLHLSPVFYPDPVNQITDMTLRLVAYGLNNCSTATDTSFVTITVYPQPVAYAGEGGETCVNTPFALADATAEHQSSVLWEVVSGEGDIILPTDVNPNYIPDEADAGTVVTLKLTVYGDGPCSNISTNDFVNIFIQDLPTVYAGPNLETCFTNAITITQASAANFGEILWTHNGNGTLNDNTTISPTYIPAAGDEGTTVQLELTAWGEGSCAGETSTSIVDILIEPIPVITQLDGGTICESGDFTTSVLVDFASAYLWEVVIGNGTVSPNDGMNTTYTAAPGDGGTTVILQLTATGSGTCSGEEVTGQVEIIVEPLPTVDAGLGGTICESESFQLNGSATNQTAVLWEVIDGIGSFDDETILNAVFTPGDVSNNTAMTLRLSASGSGICNGELATSEVIINVEPLPEADAGLGGIICETQGYHFANASAQNSSSFVWEIQDGSGHFDNPLNISPVFYPDPVNQITDMTLRLVAYGLNNCSTATDTSFVTITVYPQPVAYAGEGGETCVNTPFALADATAEHQSSVLWEVVSGVGYVDSPLNVNPTYIPDEADAGTVVTLKLTVYGDGPCSNISTNDLVNIFIQGLPTVEAGPNLQTCFADAITITQASAANYEEIFWTHDGNGTLNNSTTISPTYIPAAGDEGNTITLTLSAEGLDACTGELATDQTTILVAPLPEAFAGLDATICELENYTILDASASFQSSVVWSVINGSGTITEPFEVNTTYIPSVSDAGTTVRLRLTVYGIGNCAAYSSFDEIDISIIESPIALFSVDSPVCQNELVSFTDQSSTTAGIIEQWVWDFGDGSVPVTINFPDNPNVSHSYTVAGVHTVTLMVTTTNGCSDLYSTEIEISPAPVAAFDHSGSLCAESEVDFIDLSQENGGGNIISWNWDFGDGSSSTAQNPSHFFNAAGDYDVSLNVTNINNCTSQPFTQTITIGDPITVIIDDTDLIACLNDPHQFNGISPEAVFWNWDFGDGSTSTLQNPTHTYTAIGNYTVTLTASDINGCQNIDVVVLTVRPNPIAFFTADQSACVNEQINFIDASISPNGQITEWLWDMGDGTVIGPITNPNDKNVVYDYEFAGSYEVELTVTDINGCTDSYSRILIIENSPLANFTYEAACEGQAVVFMDLSSPNGGSDLLSWQWNFGDPLSGTNNSSSLQNPSHIFIGDMPAGGYIVSLTVTNTQGCFNTFQLPVEVNQNQIITILTDQNPVCLGNPIQFSSDATNVTSWLWNFGDGNTSTQANPNHTYQFAGNYNVTLNIQDDNGCTASATLQAKVNELPTALFTNTTPGCGLQTITFTDQSVSPNGAIVEWLWDFGDGNTSTLQNPDNEYLTAGTFIVSLDITDETGCTDSYQKTIFIQNAPIANFAFEAACVGQPVIFTDLSSVNNGSEIISWSWNFGDPASGTANNSVVQNPIHIFVGNMPTGGFTVSLTVTNVQGCTDTFEAQVELNESQIITITTDNDTHCLGEIVQFSSDATNVTSWLWNFGDGNTSTQASPSHTYQFAGNYNVTLNIQDANGCNASATHQLTVNELPTALFTNTTPGCGLQTITFTDLSVSPNGAIVDWLWDFGDGNTSTLQNPDNEYLTAGTFIVSLEVTDATGCTDSYQKTISIQTAPIANFAFEAACIGQPVIFTDLSSVNNGSDIISWLWDFGDPASGTANTSAAQNPTHIFVGNMPAGGFTVSLTVTNVQGCTDIFETQVELSEGQTITITTDNDIHCMGEIVQFNSNATNVVSWLWNFGDGNTSTQANPSHIYQFPGNYNVTLNIQDANGCTASDAHQVQVNELPTANFSNSAPGCPDETIYFTDLSISPNGGIANWHWDFGDGDEINIDAPNNPNVEHIYANSGTYNVTLTVTDVTGCEDSFTRQIVTENAPLANFTFTQTCFGEPVLFTDLSSPNGGSDLFSWAWDFGNPLSGINNSSTLQNPSHLFTDPGVYTVSLTVTNTQGCPNTFEAEVTVSETVDIDFETAATAFCPGEIIDFTPIGDDIVSYAWDFGDGGTSIQQTPTYIYTQAGTYTVSLLVTAIDGCQGYVEHDVVINEEPLAAFSTDSPSCSGAPTLFFNASSSPTGYITEWIWNFGDGSPEVIIAFPDNPDVEYSYPNEGTYNASLTVTNSNGCSNSISHEVIVAPGPIAAFDHNGSCAEGLVSFIDLSQENGGGIITGWEWNFGDLASGTANTSMLQNPEHIFTAPGDYDVELIITNINGCTNSVVNTITIDEALLVEIIADNEALCLGTAVNFTGTAAGAVIWSWDFGDGSTATVQNPSHTYTSVGNFTVSLTAETADGCSNTATLDVVVNPSPIARFVNSGPTCSSDSVYFTNQSTTPNGFIQTFIWDMGDGTVITVEAPANPNISHLYANPGTFNASLTVIDNAGCENTSSNLVQVQASPIADFSSGESCFGAPVFFTDLTSPNGGPDLYGWQWWFGDPNSGINNTSTLQNPTHLFSAAGTFNVTLVVTNTIGCSDTVVNQVVVSALPDVDFTIANDSICLNTAAEFTGIGVNINTWFWEFGDGGSSIQQSPTYMYAQPGRYDVKLTVTNINQCQNSITKSIFVNDAPIANFSMSNGCLGDSTYFMDETVSLNGFIESWAWDFGDGNTASVQNPAHLYEDADDYLVTLTATDNFGCFETISRWVSIYEKPTAAFSFNQVCNPVGKVFFFNESESSNNGSPILEYEWNFHDGYFSNEINPNHIFPETDTCYVVSLTITDAFGCESVATDTICIWEPLTVDFTATEVCMGLPTFFEASYLPADDSIVSYAWNFNDGSDIFLTYRDTTSHIFALAGTYFVELTTTNLDGCENTIYREVIVNGLPLPNFSYLPGLCDDPVAFTDLSVGNGALVESWFWDFGDPGSGDDNFSTLQSPSHLYNDQGGIYQVKLIVINFNGCIDSITKEVIQDPCVQASFIAPAITLCADSTICFTDNSYIGADNGTINRWVWNFGDNTPDYEYTVLENPVCHTFVDREGGEFIVSLTIEATVNGNPFTDTHTDTITIYPKPTARFIPAPVCQNTDALFVDNSIGNGLPVTGWYWDFGDLTTVHDTSSTQNPAYRYPDYGLFDVQLVVSNAFNCTDTLVSEIEIYQPPTADFIAVDSCVSYITYFNNLTVTGGASINNYFWHFGDPGSNNSDGNPWTDSTSTDRWAEHIYNSTGTYFATLVVEDDNSCRDTVRRSLPVHPIPNASFIYEDRYEGKQGQVFFESTSDATATSFFWDFMTGDFSNEENPVYQFEEDGLYDVMLIAYNDHLCQDTAINQYEIIFTGLYFPNTFIPNSEDPKVNNFKGLGENLLTYNLEVYTSWGQLIWSSTALDDGKPTEAWDGTFNNQDLPTGTYIWKASASFKDGTIWEGSDNGDGNLKTYGILNLIR